MNFQQILALLIAKFSGVRKDGLEQMARTLALQCTNEDEAKTLVEKITDAQANDFVKEYRKVVDKEVSEAGKTLETNLKKKLAEEARTRMCARLLCFLMKKRPETDVLGRFRILNLQILDFQGL